MVKEQALIRRATRMDISRIAEILVFGKRVAYRTIFNDDIASFNEIQVYAIIKAYEEQPSLIKNILVYDDGIIKGIINRQVYIQGGEHDAVELCELYVEPFFKNIGIGSKLIKYFIEETRAEKKKKIYLWVIKANLKARKFYEVNGFLPDGEERIIDGTNVVEMRYIKIV